jgi:predicted Zn-dependent peptidase
MLTPAEQIRRLERVTAADIKRIAAELILTKRLNVSLIGPFKTSAEFSRLLKV